MSDQKNALSAPPFFIIAILLSILALSALACTFSATPTPAPVVPTDPPPPAAEQEASPAPAEVQPETAPEPADGMNIVGFWRTKIVTKQVLIFEYQEAGQMIWHYHLNNGQQKDVAGTYSLAGNLLSVNIDNPQDLTLQIDGDMLTLTGPDGSPITLQRIANVDDPGPTASTNISQDIVNRWQDTAVQEWLDFKTDGTVSITSNETNNSGTYTITDNSLEIKLDNQESASTFRVEIDGNVLTLYAQDGAFTDYVK
jgi:hypothetical protein